MQPDAPPPSPLTPADEMGLSGLGLASRVRRAFLSIPAGEAAALLERLRQECQRRGMIYVHAGVPDTVRLLALPVAALPRQLTYVHAVSLARHNALKRLPDAYLSDPEVRAILLMSEEEEAWLRECWGPSQRESNPVFGRLDAVIDFTSPMWKDSLRFVEPNLSGIGGLQLMHVCESIAADVLLPALRRRDPQLSLEVGHDIRELLIQEILDHLEAIGRPRGTICLVEPKYADEGPCEQDALARHYAARHGLRVLHADPSELELRHGTVRHRDVAIDLVYRDYTVGDLLALRARGHDIEPMRLLYRGNRVVSSIGAEVDQKACFEVLTDPGIASRHFTSEERQIFRRHVLWTRRLLPCRTTLPDGRSVDLVEHVRREREGFVIKPNRAYGGEGIVIGLSASQAEWEAALQRGLETTDPAQLLVVQQVATIPVTEFPVLRPGGALELEPFHTVMGFAPSRYGLAIFGRASQRQVVNVAQRGGMCAVVIGHPAGGLAGPSAA
jgi:hypothetical protein